jgi:hypothetical protein
LKEKYFIFSFPFSPFERPSVLSKKKKEEEERKKRKRKRKRKDEVLLSPLPLSLPLWLFLYFNNKWTNGSSPSIDKCTNPSFTFTSLLGNGWNSSTHNQGFFSWCLC